MPPRGSEVFWVHQEADPPAESLRDLRVVLILSFAGPILLRDERGTLDVIQRISAARADLHAVKPHLRAEVLRQCWDHQNSAAAFEFAVLAELLSPESNTATLGRTMNYMLSSGSPVHKFYAYCIQGMERSRVEAICDKWFELATSAEVHPQERPSFTELCELFQMQP